MEDTNPTFARNAELPFADLNGEVVVMDAAGGNYYGMNGTASEVWKLLGKGMTVEHLIEALRRRYDGNADEIRRDVLMLMRQWQSFGLIAIQNPAVTNAPI